MKSSAWILLSGGLIALAFAPGACGGGTHDTTGAGGATVSSGTTATHMTTTVVTGMGGGPTQTAVCDAPSISPSHGACYTAAKPPMPPACPHGTGGGSTTSSSGSTTTGSTSAAATSGAGGSGTTSSSSGSTGSSGAGGGFDCSTALKKPTACGLCVEKTCCVELAACGVIPNCIACALGTLTDPAICHAADIKAAIVTLVACDQGCCAADCYKPAIPCNPVTNAPCDTANGEGCDVAQGGLSGYQCYSQATESAVCYMCDESGGVFCAGGLACLPDGHCAKYCCDDGDCGSGRCDKTTLPGETTVGVCLRK